MGRGDSQRLDSVHNPTSHRITPARDSRIDKVLCLVFVLTPQNGKQHLARWLRDRVFADTADDREEDEHGQQR